jgi:hypothetical protein
MRAGSNAAHQEADDVGQFEPLKNQHHQGSDAEDDEKLVKQGKIVHVRSQILTLEKFLDIFVKSRHLIMSRKQMLDMNFDPMRVKRKIQGMP